MSFYQRPPVPSGLRQPPVKSIRKRKELVPLSRRTRKWVTHDVSNYQQLEQVGEGTYG